MKTRSTGAGGVALLVLLLTARAGPGSQNPGEGSEAFARCLRDRAAPLETVEPGAGLQDLEALRHVIGDASIVCLGESQHLMREQYQLKHRIVRFLVEKMGFTHLAIEDSLYGTIAIDDHIKGDDTTAEDVLRGTAGWYLWDTEEMLDLVRWLRAHNERMPDGRKVSYVGLDIQDPRPGYGSLLEYFRRVDPDYAVSLSARKAVFEVFDKPFWGQVRAAYPGLGANGKQAIADTLKEAANRLEARRSGYVKAAGDKAHRDAVLVAAHMLKSHNHFLELEQDDDGVVGVREKAMFENIVRIKGTAGPRARIIVWVHNAHAAKSPVRFLNRGSSEGARLELLGTMLERTYGPEVKSIGMASLGLAQPDGTFEPAPDTLDHVLAGTGPDLFFLDLAGMKASDGPGAELGRSWKLTADFGAYLSLVPADAFDGLVFIKHVTEVRRSPEAARRFKGLF